MALVTTPGAANANSYASVAEADSYASEHLYASGWLSASSAQKEAALIMSCRLLDAMPRAWTGAATTSVQALGWPRTGMTNRNGFGIAVMSIPLALKNAQSEFARQLLSDDRTEDNDVISLGLQSVKAGPVAVTFKEKESERLALARRDSLEAVVPEAVIMLLVPSWLKDVREEDEAYTGFICESL